MISYLELIASVAAGAAGYLIVTFWIQPILRYRELKYKLTVDLIYYANAINPEGMNEFIEEHHRNRVLSLRRHSAEFIACYMDLPLWYQGWLENDKEEPMNAATHLMGLSNTRDYHMAAQRVRNIEEYLRIKVPGI